MNKNKIIIEQINKYETKFNGGLKFQYKENEEGFLNDLTKEIQKNGINEILNYYKSYLKSMSNLTNEKRLAIENLILLLQGC